MFDWVGDLLIGIFEFIIRALYGVIRLIIHTIGLILSNTWVANHFGAMRSFGIWLALIMSSYLLFGIVRSAYPPLYTPGLTWLFQWQIVVGAMVLLLVGIALTELDKARYVPDNTRHAFEPDRPVAPAAPKDTGPIQSLPTTHSAGLVATLVLVVLVIGGISALSSERHEATLAEKLCAQADARISDGVEQRVRDGAGWLDRVLGTQTADRIPCGTD